jgi:transmembrane sensor
MPPSTGRGGDAEALRLAAADWFARMRGPDANSLRLEFERWRAADPARRDAYARLEAHYALAAGLRNTSVGRARQRAGRRRWSNGWGAPRFALAAAALCLAVIAAGVTWRSVQPEDAILASAVTSGIGQIRTLRLADGTSVTLDTDSAISVGFNATGRIVRLLQGRARFDVAPERRRPFVVEADGRSIVATGTLFDVALWRGDVRVNLLRGLVDVRRGTALKPAAGMIAHLTAGQSCAIGASAAPAIGRTPAGAALWVDGMLSFDATPLGEVLAQTNRYSREQIQLGDASLAPLRVTGVFRPTPTAALAASLAAAFGLRVDHPAARRYVLRRR